MKTNITTTNGQDMGSVGYGTFDAAGRVSEYEVVGNIKEETITTDAQTLDPIINQIKVNSSYNNAIYNEATNNVLLSENTLPVSYLTEKVNQLIVDSNVTTLPVITTNSTTASYNTFQPIIHNKQTVYTNGNTDINNLADINNINITGNNYGTEYNFSSSSGNADYSGNIGGIGNIGSYSGIIGVEGISDNNFNTTNFSSLSNGNNNYFTTQTTETTTTHVSQYEKPYIGPVQDSYIEGSQQIQYGV